jgi:hypothetical protein
MYGAVCAFMYLALDVVLEDGHNEAQEAGVLLVVVVVINFD